MKLIGKAKLAFSILIACLFSFYNAGSGTNQSNHMYKLGPVHQGILERGCKTGSFSYLLLESHIAAFSVVIGKHMTNIDLPYFPFSYISEENSKTTVFPGKNLFSIGILVIEHPTDIIPIEQNKISIHITYKINDISFLNP